MTSASQPTSAPHAAPSIAAPQPADADTTTEKSGNNLRLRQRDLLRIYAWYRVAIALILLGLFTTGVSRGSVGTLWPTLYLNTAITYAVFNVAWLIYLFKGRFHTSPRRIGSILGCDILAFLLLIQASGGLDSGVGYLLLTTCAVGSLLLDRRMGAFLAAIASIAVIGQQLAGLALGVAETQDIVSAGSLGILLFTAVSALQYLSAHIRLANRKAEQERLQAVHLQRLTQQIVAQMRTGVIVLDHSDRVELINRAAQQLLGEGHHAGNKVSESLQQTIEQLRGDDSRNHSITRDSGHGELRVSLASLPRSPGSRGSLVFLEDNRKLVQQAQQLKLASLGRLTASIAHEVRNPLGAISHAAQLLAESPSITSEDRQLTDIICRHSQRVNQIIENVMQLSRRETTSSQLLDLGDWIQQFIRDFSVGAPHDASVTLSVDRSPVLARFDPSQLSQILTNLCNNGLQHSHAATGRREIEIHIYFHAQRECACLEVLDWGHGVAEEHRDKIFEPFFTTESSGAGLGLYIARELCETIRANIYYCRAQDKRSCFRVEFANTEQKF
ncbi:ATP-binding protein [uncultured Microbulbifer sp.]|uniref:sensor histidine kinase n=1 Tax=uncultured Microbulbifer sp. TaxID=348147 RepID=UPI0025DAA1B8|nr:ATP-binding protein [uncultured Microbulbifer sp.]